MAQGGGGFRRSRPVHKKLIVLSFYAADRSLPAADLLSIQQRHVMTDTGYSGGLSSPSRKHSDDPASLRIYQCNLLLDDEVVQALKLRRYVLRCGRQWSEIHILRHKTIDGNRPIGSGPRLRVFVRNDISHNHLLFGR
jgi:hypothetical protein